MALRSILLLLVVPLVVAAAVVPASVFGNGRVVAFVRQVAGPYEIGLGTIPGDPGVGSLHLTLTVSEVATKASVLNATIVIAGTGPGGQGKIGPLAARANAANPTFYDLNTSVDLEGTWVFNVHVSASLGEASADFPIDVRNTSPLVGVLTLLLLLVFVTILGLSLRRYVTERGKA